MQKKLSEMSESELAEFAIENGLPIGPTGEPVGWQSLVL